MAVVEDCCVSGPQRRSGGCRVGGSTGKDGCELINMAGLAADGGAGRG